MNTLNILPYAKHETTIAFIYPLGVSLSLFIVGSAVAIILSKKWNSRVRDRIDTVESAGEENYRDFVRTLEDCRKLTIERLPERIISAEVAPEDRIPTTEEG